MFLNKIYLQYKIFIITKNQLKEYFKIFFVTVAEGQHFYSSYLRFPYFCEIESHFGNQAELYGEFPEYNARL